MNYSKIIFESKDVKTFTIKLKELLKSDSKAHQLFSAFKKDKDKIVDYIDYVMTKYDRKLDSLMKEFDVDYEDAIDILTKGV